MNSEVFVLSLSIGVLVGIVYRVSCYLSSENLAATWWYEWKLRGTDPRSLDAACQANPVSSGLVVSLTTIPSRLAIIAPTLKSLLRQSARPLEIRLCLPAWSVRENRVYEVPAWIRELTCISIVSCEDYGPATKFIPTLKSVALDQPVVVVDDDRIYHPELLAQFAALARTHPQEVISAAGWNVPEDLVDRPTTLIRRLKRAAHVPVRANQLRKFRRVDIVQGTHGYVVRPRFFDLEKLHDMDGFPAQVRFVDDVLLSAAAEVPCVVYPMRLSFTDFLPWEFHSHVARTSLGKNVNYAERDENRGNSVAIRYFKDRWKRFC